MRILALLGSAVLIQGVMIGCAAPTPTPTMTPTSPPASAAGAFPELTCESRTMAISDHTADAVGSVTDLEQATRDLPEVRPTDVVVVSGDRTAVVRDGEAILIAAWFLAGGGWLLHQTQGCDDVGPT